MNTTRTHSSTAPRTAATAHTGHLTTRLSALALAGLLTGVMLLGVNTLASVDGAAALMAASTAQHRA